MAGFLAGVTSLIWGGSSLVRVLGAVVSLVIVILTKIVSENDLQLTRLDSRIASLSKQVAELHNAMSSVKDQTEQNLQISRASDRELADRLNKAEADTLQARQLTERLADDLGQRLESLQESNRRGFLDLFEELNRFIAAYRPIRRHTPRSDVSLRELSLKEALSALSDSSEDP
jgi:DNA anti-recombination protein RmuC